MSNQRTGIKGSTVNMAFLSYNLLCMYSKLALWSAITISNTVAWNYLSLQNEKCLVLFHPISQHVALMAGISSLAAYFTYAYIHTDLTYIPILHTYRSYIHIYICVYIMTKHNKCICNANNLSSVQRINR